MPRRSAANCVVMFTFMMLCGAASAQQHFVITKGTEHQVYNSFGPGREGICFRVTDLHTDALAIGHFRRTANGRRKDLDQHLGGRCLSTVPGQYVVYISAPNQDLCVNFTRSGMPEIKWACGRR
jgi:hypothetical protein